MTSTSSPAASPPSWTTWPPHEKRALLSEARRRLWKQRARTEPVNPCDCGDSHSQLPPEGSWRVWYLRGGRGGGKTRTGAETLADWITEAPAIPGTELNEWAICAPTFGDARSVCAEGPSGLISVLGGVGALITSWNRSEGVIHIVGDHGRHVVYLDGANDGALRIQGKNLRGLWADEVGLWEKWDTAWNESIRFAVRMPPSRIVATGTPKMGHELVKQLLQSTSTVVHHLPTLDNEANLDAVALSDLEAQYGGSTLGRQELQGEYIEALEGSILSRHDWRWFDCRSHPVDPTAVAGLPRFDRIVHSWDTALKGKTSSDPVAGQVWGCAGPDRYLLRLWHGPATLDSTIVHMLELRAWAGERWPNVPQYVLIETSANGADAIRAMRAKVDGVQGYNPRDGGDKVARAFAASPALETGCCYLPGYKEHDPNGRGYRSDTPPEVQAFVEEAAMFRGDMKHAHDDQVDAWSQMVNWTRQAGGRSPAKMGRPEGELPVYASVRR